MYSIDKRKYFEYFTLIPVVAIMLIIFLLSAQNGTQSSGTSGYVGRFVLSIVEPEFEQLSKAEQDILVDSFQHIIRKTAHFLEYAALGFFLMLHIRARGISRMGWLWALGIGVLYAVTDELHQFLVGTRSGQVSDVLLDGWGVLFGIGCLLAVWFVVGKLRKNHRVRVFSFQCKRSYFERR